MLYFSIALVISVAFVVFSGINITIKHEYILPEAKPPIVTGDIYGEDGNIKSEFDGKETSMDAFIQDVNTLMTSGDKEIK